MVGLSGKVCKIVVLLLQCLYFFGPFLSHPLVLVILKSHEFITMI